MSRYDDLNVNVDEVVSIVKSALAELKVAEKEATVAEERKRGILIDINDLEKDLKELKSTKQEIIDRYKQKDAEILSLKTSYLNQIKDIQLDKEKIQLKINEYEIKSNELKDKFELLSIKQKQTTQRLTESNDKLRDAEEKLEKAERINTELDNRELKLKGLENKSKDKMQEAITKELTAMELWHGAEEQKRKNDDNLFIIEANKKKQVIKENELALLKEELNGVKSELDKREQAVQYLELRINKIIKEKNIADILGEN